MEKAKPILSIQNISMKFGGIVALSNINFDIEPKSITALIGPNGAGKTTVFNCCTGFYCPTDGKIIFDSKEGEKDVNVIAGQKLNLKDILDPKDFFNKLYHKIFSGSFALSILGISRTFQNVRLFKEMTVIENLLVAQHQKLNTNLISGTLNTKDYHEKEAQCIEEAFFWLKKLNLENEAQKLAGALAYGKTRKLELARAMATSPTLVCLDEPAAGLNQQETEELSEIIRSIKEESGVTVFLIEHDMRMVMKISEKIVVLDHGEVIAQGSADEVKNNPNVIEAYLGSEDDGL